MSIEKPYLPGMEDRVFLLVQGLKGKGRAARPEVERQSRKVEQTHPEVERQPRKVERTHPKVNRQPQKVDPTPI